MQVMTSWSWINTSPSRSESIDVTCLQFCREISLQFNLFSEKYFAMKRDKQRYKRDGNFVHDKKMLFSWSLGMVPSEYKL